MTPSNFTVSDEIVRHAFLSELYPDGQSKFLEVVLTQLLQTYASEICRANPYQQIETRWDCRNGYQSRPMTTELSSIEREAPRLRNQNFRLISQKIIKDKNELLLWELLKCMFKMFQPEMCRKSPIYCLESQFLKVQFRKCSNN
jgi:hypothetical protein